MTRRPPTILVVDDAAAIADSLRRALMLEGFDTVVAGDGEGALALDEMEQLLDELEALLEEPVD